MVAENDVTHQLIRPQTPTDNAEIERCQRTIGKRLHSALKYVRPVDYYRGDPEALLAERCRKLNPAWGLRR